MFDEHPLFCGGPVAASPQMLAYRHRTIIETHQDWYQDARVLDMASYDGRWSFAALNAGAAYVEGVEAREPFVTAANRHFQHYDVPAEKYSFILGDVHEYLKQAPDNSFDVVLCLGFFYHIHNHYDTLKEIVRIAPKFVLDTVVTDKPGAVIDCRIEGEYPGTAFYEKFTGTPSRDAIDMMLAQVGCTWEYHQVKGEEFVPKDYSSNWMAGRSRVTLFAKRKRHKNLM